MNNYLIVTLSVIIFLAFLDLITSSSKNGKVVKMVTSLIAVTMLAVPIISIVKNENLTQDKVYYNEYLNDYLVELEKKVVQNKIESALKDLECKFSNVNVEFIDEKGTLILEKITVKFDTAVINENGLHIDILESVKNSLKSAIDIQKVEIIVETD